MNHLCIFIILLLTEYAISDLSDFTVSSPQDKISYKIGEKVILTCIVKGDVKLSVLFRHNNQYKAENAMCNFNQYKCSKNIEGEREYHIFEISTLTWSDGGEWLCVQGDDTRSKTITIDVIGKVERIRAQIHHSVSFEHAANVLYGKGVRINPYDLTRNAVVRLECQSGCNSPPRRLSWSYRNASTHSRALSVANQTSGSCRIKPDGTGSTAGSSVLVNCTTLGLVGSNEVTCAMAGANDSRSVFVLCPGGHKPWTLTNGEIIGISIAVSIAALMVVMFFVSAKRIINSYQYGYVGQGIHV